MQLNFYFDQSRCTGCQTCVVACRDWNDVLPGQMPWLRKQTVEKGHFPEVRVTFLHSTCFHCEEPPCVPACPTGALSKREKDGIVMVNRELCTPNCEACFQVCPYQALQFSEIDALVEKCDFCLERVEAGLHPVCIDSCPQRALDYGTKRALKKKYPSAVPWVEGYPDPKAVKPSLLIKPSDA